MMKYWYDQRYRCCETCHYFRDSLIEGRKACGEYGMAFWEQKGIVDDTCEKHRTEEQWQEEERIRAEKEKEKGKTKSRSK